MKSQHQLRLVLLLGIIASFGFGLLRGGTTLATYTWGPDAPEPRTGEPRKRHFRESRWSLVQDLGAEEVGEGTASRLRRGPGKSLLTLNYRTRKVWQIEPESGKSRAFGPAVHPILDFGTNAAGQIWWIEDGVLRLQWQGPAGTAPGATHLEDLPLRVSVADDGRFVAAHADFLPHLFQAYAADGSPAASFGRFLAGKTQDPMVLEGNLARLSGSTFVYAPHYLPFLAAFSFDGELLYRQPLVGQELGSPPKIVRGPRESRNLEPGTPVRSFSVLVQGGRIALLSELFSPGAHHRVLDFYDQTDGTYLESLRLPEGTRDALFVEGELYTLQRDGIRRWHLADPGEDLWGLG